MQALIDGDIFLHEIGWSCQFKDKETGEEILFDFDRAAEFLDEKIRIIQEEVGATQPPIIFVTNSEWLSNKMGTEFHPSFRYSVAKTKPYKGTRNNPKPFHFYNILVYMLANYDTRVAEDGLEADDAISTYQFGADNTIICSRDKDLRICPGWHYSWECGKQASIGPIQVDRVGFLDFEHKPEIVGYGLSFFYYQMLVGDATDNIPGLSGCGSVAAKKLLEGATSEYDLYSRVKKAYKEKLGDLAKDYFFEQANLLWIRQQEGVGFIPPKKE